MSNFNIIEGGNPSRVDLRKLRIDMIRNEIPQYTFEGVSRSHYYRKDLQAGAKDIENEDYLSGMMYRYYDYSHQEFSEIREKVERNFTPFFSQKHKTYNFFEDLIMYVDWIIIHIGQQIHPYQWKYLREILESFFIELNDYINALDVSLHVPDVVNQIDEWIYRGENGGVIGEGLRALKGEVDERIQMHSRVREVLSRIAGKFIAIFYGK